MGCEFVEVTAHPGARPSHAVWQGKVFHIGGAVTVKLRRAREELKIFLKETGLRQDNFREQVADFGRSAAAKATARAQQSHKAWLKSIGAEKTELNTLAKYYEGKYHNGIEYQRLMGYSKAVEKADISPLVGFDTYQEYCESVQKNIIGQTTSTGVRLESFALHFIDRLIGQTSEPHPGKRLGVSVEDALDALINPVSVSDVRTAPSGDKRQTFTGKKTDVTISITDKLLIQTNPRGK